MKAESRLGLTRRRSAVTRRRATPAQTFFPRLKSGNILTDNECAAGLPLSLNVLNVLIQISKVDKN